MKFLKPVILVFFVLIVGYLIVSNVGSGLSKEKQTTVVVLGAEGKQLIENKTNAKFMDIFTNNMVTTDEEVKGYGNYLGKIKVGSYDTYYEKYDAYETDGDIMFVLKRVSHRNDYKSVVLRGKDAEFAKLVIENNAKANTFSWIKK